MDEVRLQNVWQYVVLYGSILSAVAYLAFALPLSWVAWRRPAWAEGWWVQPQPADVQRWFWPGLRWFAINQVILFGLLTVLWPWIGPWCAIRLGGPPPWYEVVWQLVFFIYLDDALYYVMHRGMHESALYTWVHAMHHRVRTPLAMTGHYMHPVEYVATGLLMLVGPQLVGAHVVTTWIWVVIRQWEAAEGHGGLHLWFSPMRLVPGSQGADFHDFHHAKFNGNYAGFLGWVDMAVGTWAKGYAEHVEARGLRWWV